MPWYIYSIATALCMTGMVLCTKYLGNKGFQAKQILTFLLVFTFLGFLLSNISTFSAMLKAENFLIFLLIIIPSAIFDVIGNLSDFTATIKSPNPGFAGAIRSSNILLITFLSFLIFQSSLGWLKLIGMAMVIIGIFLIAVKKINSSETKRSEGLRWEWLALIAALSFTVTVLAQKKINSIRFFFFTNKFIFFRI